MAHCCPGAHTGPVGTIFDIKPQYHKQTLPSLMTWHQDNDDKCLFQRNKNSSEDEIANENVL